jgi:hypothetical protein
LTDIAFPGNVYVKFPEKGKLSKLLSIILHEMGHLYQGWLIILYLLGSDMAKTILTDIQTCFGLNFEPGDMSKWMPEERKIIRRPSELLPHSVQYALVMLLSGPKRKLDLYPWNMLSSDAAEAAEWEELADKVPSVGNSEVIDFIVRLLTGRG